MASVLVTPSDSAAGYADPRYYQIMFSHLFTRKLQAAVVRPEKCEVVLPRSGRIVAPALGAHFSVRALKMMCRIVGGPGCGDIRLVYFMEVPRAYALAASLPAEEAFAESVLQSGLRAIHALGYTASTEIQRGRDPVESLLRYIVHQDVGLLVLGAKRDNVRGIPFDIARDLYDRAACPVLLDYAAGETGLEGAVGLDER